MTIINEIDSICVFMRSNSGIWQVIGELMGIDKYGNCALCGEYKK